MKHVEPAKYAHADLIDQRLRSCIIPGDFTGGNKLFNTVIRETRIPYYAGRVVPFYFRLQPARASTNTQCLS
jgi:hypothetical protein